VPTRLPLLAVLLGSTLLLPAAPVHADNRLNMQLGGTVADCSRPAIASSQTMFSLTAWEEAGHVRSAFEGILCVGLPQGAREWRHDHGPGAMPEVGVLNLPFYAHTYILAYVRGDSLVVRECDGESAWSTVSVSYLGAPTPLTSRPDLWCSRRADFPDSAWLTIWSGTFAEGGLRCLRRDQNGWGELQTVTGAASELLDLSFPQATDHDGPQGPLPRLYYVDLVDEPVLKHVELSDAGDWSAPVAHDGIHAFGGEFDAARSPDGYVFLTNGLQPTCPCNRVDFCEWTEQEGWLEPIPLTVPTDAYDWPLSPRIGVDGGGRVHALWFQLGSDEMLEPRHRRLHYRQREDAVWEDHTGDLVEIQDLGLDAHVSLGIDSGGEAAMAWAIRDTIEGVPQPATVWISFFDFCGLGAGDAPHPAVAVSAAPNPFNPAVEISAVADDGAVAVEIYDTRGRRIAAMTPTFARGSWRATWDGRDASGRAAPSGSYLARVRDGAGATASCKIVLAR